MSQEFNLPLAGLNCGRCIAKIEKAFADNPQVQQYSVTKTDTQLTTSLSYQEIVKLITDLGYSIPKAQHITLYLSGLNCGKCVNKTKEALSGLSHSSITSISTTLLKLETTYSQQHIIDLIESIGFHASSVSPASDNQEQQTPLFDNSKTDNISHSSEKMTQLILSGMTCASCVSSVEKIIAQNKNVRSVTVNLAERTALVHGDIDVPTLIKDIEDGGYGAELSVSEEQRRERQKEQFLKTTAEHKRNTILSLSIGAPLMLWGVFGGNMQISNTHDQLAWGVIGFICLGLLLTAGRHFFVNAWKAFTHHRATMDTLVALGTGSAWLYSMALVLFPEFFPEQARHVYFEATAMILGLITLGNLIETKARNRTSNAIEKLINLQPQTATVIIDGQEVTLPVAQVIEGMVIKIKPGEKIPVDGTILSGESYLDEAMLTGEPIPSLKSLGNAVHAGTINQQGSFTFKATKVGEHTMLARIITMVRNAQSSKPKLAKLADKISSIFVPTVMIIAILSALIWYNFGPEPTSSYMLVVATTVLIIACPCALGLATPMSVTVGIGKAAEFGALIKDADVLQTASTIDTVVVDKTGTLTEGKPRVSKITAVNQYDEKEVISLAAAVEIHSEHPLALAVVNYLNDNQWVPFTSTNFAAELGLGASAKVNGNVIFIGNRRYLAKNNIPTPDISISPSATPLYVANEQECIGVIQVSDAIRLDSKAAIKQFNQLGIDVVMLTGDRKETAKHVAKELGINQIIADVLPDGKAQAIQELQKQGKKVAMIGDGINDAPALAQAEVGIAMGNGSDVAIESAHLTLMNHSLLTAVNAIKLSKATMKNMKQNLFGAFIYNTIGIPVAAGILFPFTGMLLSPVVAGAAMALSSITVVTNANRLRLFTPQSQQK
ncbi:cadmium-translocating P-type ATPase [Aliivibrio fischeri]|uniref:heavy metal translocating P-type ATPase n=1 Tax=Aliivibrio fischeri TaxID=668 RepID=UPI0012D9C681|nr:heavy metal translocating P-type ATPase [Aliivibrio fischeri]MUK60494.1 cadmium-translocating P-type ATPase [Aliivibrio fischeri]MUL19643.1 cadmium-translocating P-type ATPase [Aliivibrio fischeri]MUL24775.1 cadmium-translocating P-type ATPase [Aliivibrio fischeri]